MCKSADTSWDRSVLPVGEREGQRPHGRWCMLATLGVHRGRVRHRGGLAGRRQGGAGPDPVLQPGPPLHRPPGLLDRVRPSPSLPPSLPPSSQAPPPPPRPRAEPGSRGPAGRRPGGAGHRPGPPRAPPSPPPAAPPPAPGRAAPPKLQLVLSDDRQTPAAREREAISFGEGEQAGRQAGGGGGGGAADLFPRRRRPRRGRDRPPGPHKPQGASRQEPWCRGVIPLEGEQAGRGGRAGADIGG